MLEGPDFPQLIKKKPNDELFCYAILLPNLVVFIVKISLEVELTIDQRKSREVGLRTTRRGVRREWKPTQDIHNVVRNNETYKSIKTSNFYGRFYYLLWLEWMSEW